MKDGVTQVIVNEEGTVHMLARELPRSSCRRPARGPHMDLAEADARSSQIIVTEELVQAMVQESGGGFPEGATHYIVTGRPACRTSQPCSRTPSLRQPAPRSSCRRGRGPQWSRTADEHGHLHPGGLPSTLSSRAKETAAKSTKPEAEAQPPSAGLKTSCSEAVLPCTRQRRASEDTDGPASAACTGGAGDAQAGVQPAAGRGCPSESGFRLVLLLLLFSLFYLLCPEVKLFSVLFPQCLPVSVERGPCLSHGTVASDTAALAVQHVPIVTIYYMFG